jgi:hypothetical protein
MVVLVDGYYHHSASVRHKEILALLGAEVSVIGCASMGALRAAELHPYGMIGSGTVFEMYRDGVLDSDDEVAVAHTVAPTYRKLSVPLVVIRCAAASARQAGVLSEAEAQTIVAVARSVHYAERSWKAIQVVADDNAQDLEDALDRLQAFCAEKPMVADVKYRDTVDTLTRVARRGGAGSGGQRDWVASQDWRNRFIAEWQTRFSVTKVENIEVSRSETLRFQQIYLDDFPRRWQRFALARVAGVAGGDHEDLVDRALAAAARHGLFPGSLTEAQTAPWLTAAESARLSGTEALIRVLVRSYQPPCPTRDLTDTQPELTADQRVQRAVAESHAINAEVASWGHRRTDGHIKRSALLEHLAEEWCVDPHDELVLLAAARDRGFVSMDDAVEAARPFFLRSRFRSLDPDLPTMKTAGQC